MSKVLSVRINEELYTKVYTGRKSRKETVTQALELYFNTRQKNNTKIKTDDATMQSLRQQISQMKAMQDHLNGEILYLRELHQNTMSRVIQIPENATYDRDPFADIQQNTAEPIKDQPPASIITKLGNVIDGYKTNNHRFL